MCLSSQNLFSQELLSFKEFPDAILLTVIKGLQAHTDSEIYTPIKFQILLPKGIEQRGSTNSQLFQFNYPKGEVIFIKTHYEGVQLNKNDTLYNASTDEVEDLFDGGMTRDFINPDSIVLDKKREYIIVKNKDATIFLYNILKKNKAKYISSAKSFKKI